MTVTPPQGFGWVIPNQLAAMAWPHKQHDAFEFFQNAGINVVVTLDEAPLSPVMAEEFGIEYHHTPIKDFHAPTLEQIEEFVAVVARAREAGKKVAVHCRAGRGRTGTMIACYLVSLGRTARQALAEIRSLRPGSVETPEQEQAIQNYERTLRGKRE